MTAAQNTIAFGAPNRFATYATAVAAGLLVIVVGIAISARPIAEPQSLAKPDRPVISVPTTIAPNEQADAYLGMLNAKAADPAIIASSVQASAYIDSLNAKAADPAIVASGEQASAYIDSLDAGWPTTPRSSRRPSRPAPTSTRSTRRRPTRRSSHRASRPVPTSSSSSSDTPSTSPSSRRTTATRPRSAHGTTPDSSGVLFAVRCRSAERPDSCVNMLVPRCRAPWVHQSLPGPRRLGSARRTWCRSRRVEPG